VPGHPVLCTATKQHRKRHSSNALPPKAWATKY